MQEIQEIEVQMIDGKAIFNTNDGLKLGELYEQITNLNGGDLMSGQFRLWYKGNPIEEDNNKLVFTALADPEITIGNQQPGTDYKRPTPKMLEKNIQDVSIPTDGLPLPTSTELTVYEADLRSTEEEKRKEREKERKRIGYSSLFILLAVATAVSGVFAITNQVGFWQEKQQLNFDTEKSLKNKCGEDIKDINFDIGPNIVTQKQLNDWESCMDEARNKPPGDICGLSYWFDHHGYCAQHDLKIWCQDDLGFREPKKGAKVVTESTYEDCKQRFNAIKAYDKATGHAAGFGMLSFVLFTSSLIGLCAAYSCGSKSTTFKSALTFWKKRDDLIAEGRGEPLLLAVNNPEANV